MGKQYSFIKYFGGKNSNGLGKIILNEFPEKGSYDIYAEPFSGGFSIGLQTPEDRIAPIEIYNDLYNNVYSLFKVISDKEKFDQFKELCDVSYYSEAMRKDFKEKLEKEELDDVHRAFYYFYVNRTSHNGNGGFSKNMVVRRNMAKSVSDMLSTIDRLPELHQRLSRTLILNRDGIDIIDNYNQPNVFLYCDPPYHQSTRTSTRYSVDMDNGKQIEFLGACLRSNAKLLISGYDCEIYEEYLVQRGGFKKIQFEVNTMTGSYEKKIKTETLWKNY